MKTEDIPEEQRGWYFILNEQEELEQVDRETWGKWVEACIPTKGRTIALTKVGELTVSTVIMTCRSDYPNAEGSEIGPLIFETLILGPKTNKHTHDGKEYRRKVDALKGHIAIVAELIEELNKELADLCKICSDAKQESPMYNRGYKDGRKKAHQEGRVFYLIYETVYEPVQNSPTERKYVDVNILSTIYINLDEAICFANRLKTQKDSTRYEYTIHRYQTIEADKFVE